MNDFEILPLLQRIRDMFTATLFNIGSTSINTVSLFMLIVLIFLLFFLSGKLKNIISDRILAKYDFDIGIRQSIGTIIKYIFLIVGLLVIIQSIGINLSSLTILAGALGVGIGFGLQNITNNFISGIIILFERPIKIGDRIQVADINGDVVSISARSTNIVTNDNISVIVPNSEFISSTVINWSHTDRNVRFRFPVGVSYKENPEVVRKLLMEVAGKHEGVLNNPEPDVLFDKFGESSLDFILAVWTSDYINRPTVLKSQLYYSIFEKFKEHGIEIPFPQQDIHVKSGIEKLFENNV